MPAVVGRADAVATVVGALGQPVPDEPVLVLIEGEAGIGKSWLLRRCLQEPALARRRVLGAVCPPTREPSPLGPLIAGARRLWRRVGPVEVSPLVGALTPLLPELGHQLPPALEPLGDRRETRHRLFRALGELVERLEVEVVVVEDAHWAGSSTLEWLLTLTTGSLTGEGMSVVVTYRPHDVPDGSLLRRLTSLSRQYMRQLRVELHPLDVEQIRGLVAEMLDTDQVSPEFASFLRERTGGLPLAVVETIRLLRDRADIFRQGEGWSRRVLAELEVPPTVRDSVLERVGRLDLAARKVLEAAAVLAEPAGETLLARVAGVAPPTAAEGVAVGLRAGLLDEVEPEQVAFRHQLAAEAVEQALPANVRRQLHLRAGRALESVAHPPVLRLSRHFRQAGDVGAWCRYAEAGADLALASGDDHTAVTMLHDLLTAVPHGPRMRAELARKLGEAAAAGAALLGDRTGQLAQTLRDVLGDSDIPVGQRGELRLLLARLLLWWPGHRQAAYHEIETAVPDLGDKPVLACHAMMLLATPLVPDWPVQRHLQWVQQATALLPQVGPPSERLSLDADRARALLALGEESGWSAYRQLPRSANSPSQRRAVADGMLKIGSVAIDWGWYDEARSQLDEAAELIQVTGYQRLLNVARVARAYLDWCTGAWTDLAETAATLAEDEATEPFTVRLHARQVQGLVDLARGRREAAQRCLREVSDAYARLGMVGPEQATATAALARVHLAEGAAAEALQLTEPVMATIVRKGVWLWATDLAPVHLSAMVGAQQLEQAADLAQRLAAWSAGRHAPALAAASLVCEAIVAEARGDCTRAAGLFGLAAAAWAVLPHPYQELLAAERQGRCLLAAGDRDDALAGLSETRSRLQRLGARWDAGRIARLLRREGVKSPRAQGSRSRGYGDRLSPRELQVLQLAAQGMTNPQIAREVWLSRRTVSHHLGSAMRKLGVSSRMSAVLAAAAAGLIPHPTPQDPTGEPPDVRE